MKKIIQKLFFNAVVFVVLCSQGCTEENTIVVHGINTPYSPSVLPAVIFTYPSNNAVGPYTNLYTGDYTYSNAHFKIQFNKVMLYDHLNADYIKITGFDEPVRLSYGTSYELDGLYRFVVYPKSTASYIALPYKLGKKYTVTVSGQMEDIHQQPLGKDYVFSFTMENAFRVMNATPKDSISVSTERVKVTFNSQIDSTILSKVTINPAVAGHWAITSSRMSMEFFNTTPFLPSTQYTLTVAGNAADKDGNALGTPYTLNFNSGIFRMTSSTPSDGQFGVSLENGMAFNFNAFLSYGTIAPAFTISPAVKGTIGYGTSTVYFYPNEPLKEKTLYTVTFKNTLTSSLGSALSAPATISFTTEGFRMVRISPYPPYEISRHSWIELWFNTAIDTSTAKNGFTFTPPIPGQVTFSDDLKKIIVKPDSILLPRSTYSIVFTNSIRSKAGNPLEYSYDYFFTTGE